MGKKRKLSHSKPHSAVRKAAPGKPHKQPNQQKQPQQQQEQKQKQKHNHHQQAAHAEPTIPFAPDDSILLVGEGDLSFAASLVEHHGCTNVTATVLEPDLAALAEKYPDTAAANAAIMEAAEGCRVLYGIDAVKMGPWTRKPGGKSSSSGGGGNDDDSGVSSRAGRSGSSTCATAAVGAMDRIIFNFPHVGGKSTDVNRQVRHHQELLVGFFRRALASLAPGGSVVVTLFEAEPYTLWNVRDLARHSGLQVERSFRFRAAAYPGYRHARTLGVVRSRGPDGERTTAESSTAWRGEERAARSYVFVRRGDVPRLPAAPAQGRKRGRSGEEDSDEGDDG